MDFMDYVEMDHSTNRHCDAYLDRMESGYSQPSVPQCKWCGERIMWQTEGQRWFPKNPDGTNHFCEARLDAQREEILDLLPNIDEA